MCAHDFVARGLGGGYCLSPNGVVLFVINNLRQIDCIVCGHPNGFVWFGEL